MIYTLNFTIDQAGVNAINGAQQFVTIVKSNLSGAPVDNPVAWLAIKPMETITVTWEEQYVIYASQTQVSNGAVITMSSQTADVIDGWLYTLSPNLTFTGAENNSPGSFEMLNKAGVNLTGGLAQTGTINGKSVTAPLNAVGVLNTETASFEPLETVSIFVSSYQNNGCVISDVASNAYVVTLSSASPTANIGYDDTNNVFIAGSAPASTARRAAAVPA